MEAITQSKLLELIARIPPTKLQAAYSFLADLVDTDAEDQSYQIKFMELPLAERRKAMAQQAEQMKKHYDCSSDERRDWQTGDFMDEY